MTTPIGRLSRMTGPDDRSFLLLLLIIVISVFIVAFMWRSITDTLIYWPMTDEQKSQSYYEKAMAETSMDKKIIWFREALRLDPNNHLASYALTGNKPTAPRRGHRRRAI